MVPGNSGQVGANEGDRAVRGNVTAMSYFHGEHHERNDFVYTCRTEQNIFTSLSSVQDANYMRSVPSRP